jgi:erythromycin esterase-like protein
MAERVAQRPLSAIRGAAHTLSGSADDYDALIDAARGVRFVLLGEASHGTHEFYSARAEITKRLITELGFAAVAVEADWPDAYRVNRYVRASDGAKDSVDALVGFERFPQWMWRNADVLDFVGWLRAHNDALRSQELKAGLYGIDLYSLFTSIEAVLAYLDKVDPEGAERARFRYACFDHFEEDSQAYGYAASAGLAASCEDAVVGQLVELRQRAADYARRDGRIAADELFYAEQNARLVTNGERYYRAMFRGRTMSWNLRDEHMADTLEALVRHLGAGRDTPKIAVWAHNSHLGDARATGMGTGGQLNVGQLVRQRYGRDALLVGFTTFAGTVSAASQWGAPVERKRVRPGLPGSYESLFHEVGIPNFLLDLRANEQVAALLSTPRLERAIGVIYRPDTERQSHYFDASLSKQFDVVLHFDETRAVEPLERSPMWVDAEVPETYPTAL